MNMVGLTKDNGEESFKMPFLIKCPGVIDSNTVSKELIMNIDFGPTLLDFAGLDVPSTMKKVLNHHLRIKIM